MPDFAPDHRLFFALQPDTITAERTHAEASWLQRRGGLGGKLRPRDTLHITLAGIGRSNGPPPSRVIDLACRSAGSVRMRPFSVGLNRLQYWRNRDGLLVLTGDEGVAGVDMLHDALTAALGRTSRAFTSHMSLIWGAREIAAQPMTPVRWAASEFVLIHSIAGQGRHDVVGRWALRAA